MRRGGCDDGNPVREDPRIVPAVGIRAGVRHTGEDGGDRKRDTAIQDERAYGEAGPSVPRGRVSSKPPSRLAEDEGPE